MEAAALLALLAPLALGSCVSDSVSLRITCNVAPESDCTYTTGGLCQLRGALNLSLPGNYTAVLRLTNGLKPRSSEIPPKSEPNGVEINELEIEITDSSGRKPNLGANVPNPFTVPANGFIEPGEDGLVGATLIPASYVARIAAQQNTSRQLGQARLSVIARGRTSGDVELESAPWNWTVELYNVNVSSAAGECVQVEDEICAWGQDRHVGTCNPAESNSE
jgi:hypothetical protein